MLIKTQQWRIKLSNLQWRLNELNEFFTVLSGFSFGEFDAAINELTVSVAGVKQQVLFMSLRISELREISA